MIFEDPLFEYDVLIIDADFYFPMDEIVDGMVIGPQQNGTLYGITTTIPGVWHNALSFDGSSQYVYMGAHPGECIAYACASRCPDGFTWAMWFMFPEGNPPDNAYIISAGDDQSDTLGSSVRHQANGKLKVTVKSDIGRFAIVDSTYPREEWFHLVYTWQAVQGLKMYINGNLVKADNVSNGDLGGDAYEELTFGRGVQRPQYANVSIDEVIYWNELKNDLFLHKLYHAMNRNWRT